MPLIVLGECDANRKEGRWDFAELWYDCRQLKLSAVSKTAVKWSKARADFWWEAPEYSDGAG